MCHHNHTQHSGCGHIGEHHTEPFTLCALALQKLSQLRGPSSPPLTPPLPTTTPFAPPKREKSKPPISSRRFFSLSALSRSSSSSTRSSSRHRRSTSEFQAPHSGSGGGYFGRSSTSSFAGAGVGAAEYGVTGHEMKAVRCAEVVYREVVSHGEMDVCKECARWIREMRFAVSMYDRSGSVKGTTAFEEFLKGRGVCR